MANEPDPSLVDDDNPEWTDEDFARARPASEVLSRRLYTDLTKDDAARVDRERLSGVNRALMSVWAGKGIAGSPPASAGPERRGERTGRSTRKIKLFTAGYSTRSCTNFAFAESQ